MDAAIFDMSGTPLTPLKGRLKTGTSPRA